MANRTPHILCVVFAVGTATAATAQGVPTFDAGAFLARERLLGQGAQDLALQHERLSQDERLAALEAEQHAALEDLLEASTIGAGTTSRMPVWRAAPPTPVRPRHSTVLRIPTPPRHRCSAMLEAPSKG